MMVFTWAQLGYLLIQTDGSKVLLRKRMDMGNERSLFENKIFALLFGSRQTVDATGYPYAKLSRKVSAIVPNAVSYTHLFFRLAHGYILAYPATS